MHAPLAPLPALSLQRSWLAGAEKYRAFCGGAKNMARTIAGSLFKYERVDAAEGPAVVLRTLRWLMATLEVGQQATALRSLLSLVAVCPAG